MSGRILYRYRTPVLFGPWRSEPEVALEDAIAAGQIRRCRDGDLAWMVPGKIEESAWTDAACRDEAPGARRQTKSWLNPI
jgi:hypothetical protein